MLPIARSSALTLTAALAACSSTKLVSERLGPADLESPLAHVVVIGVSDNAGQRAAFEEGFAAALRARTGIRADAAIDLLGADLSLDKDALRDAIRARGFDAVLVARKVGERAEVRARRTGGLAEVDYSAYDDFHGRYLTTLQSSTSEVATRMVRAEVTLLRTSDYREVWTGTTDSHDPRDLHAIARELADVVVAQLRHHRLLR